MSDSKDFAQIDRRGFIVAACAAAVAVYLHRSHDARHAAVHPPDAALLA